MSLFSFQIPKLSVFQFMKVLLIHKVVKNKYVLFFVPNRVSDDVIFSLITLSLSLRQVEEGPIPLFFNFKN